MTNVTIVGYKDRITRGQRRVGQTTAGLITWLPGRLERIEGIHYGYIDIIEERDPSKTIENLVDEMLNTNPDILHYANFRDIYQEYEGKKIDSDYIKTTKRKNPKLPILLTSILPDAEAFAREEGIAYLDSSRFRIRTYLDTIANLTRRG